MWMLGCGNDMNTSHHHHDSSSSSSLINNQRLKQQQRLMPKIPPFIFSIPTHLHDHDDQPFTFNHHLAADQRYKKEVESQQQLYASAKTRWNPTPAQLHALENIYRHGTRTPSSEQIQHIANQLRQYGDIEGKNVFYWFQNHKARERQKRRRVSETFTKNCLVNVTEDQQHAYADDIPDSAEVIFPSCVSTELRKTSFEVIGQTNNNWALPNSNFTTHSEEPAVLIHRDAAAAVVVVKSKSADGWIELEDTESSSPQRRKHVVREKITTVEENKSTRRKKLITSSDYYDHHEDYEIADQSQTLELFPLRSDDDHHVKENHSITPIQFFEFL